MMINRIIGWCQCNISFHLIFAYRSPRAGAHATHQAAQQHRDVVEGPFLRPDQSAAKRKYWQHTTYRMRYRYQQSIRIRYYYVVRTALIGVSHPISSFPTHLPERYSPFLILRDVPVLAALILPFIQLIVSKSARSVIATT